MSCLDATFTLTPRSPLYYDAPYRQADLVIYGADFSPWSQSFETLYAMDAVYLNSFTAADPSVNYSNWSKRMKVPFLDFFANLSSLGPAKSLALVFGFEAPWSPGRVLVYNDAGLISDQTLATGDNQILLEIASLDSPIFLYFVHAGGDWLFKGLSGYVV